MTKNTTTDRTELVSKHVGDALHDGFMMIYERLDNLHKRGIDDGEVIQALHNLGEEKLLEAYAEWAEIDLHPGDNNITMDPIVPDPYDAPSYTYMNAEGVAA